MATNQRKKYINLERLNSDEIVALLDSVGSDDEQELDDLMNDSDTEFIAGDEIGDEDLEKDVQIEDIHSSTTVPSANVHFEINQADADDVSSLSEDLDNSKVMKLEGNGKQRKRKMTNTQKKNQARSQDTARYLEMEIEGLAFR